MQNSDSTRAASRPKKQKTLKLLVEAAELLASTLSLTKLYESLLTVVEKAMPCDGFIVSAYNSQTREITCDYAYTSHEVLDAKSFPAIRITESGGMQSEVIRSGQSRIYLDVQSKVAEAGGTYFEVKKGGALDPLEGATKTSTKEAMMVPIKLDEIVVGVLHVSSEGGDRGYDEEDLRLLEGLVHQLAIAVQNARLYERARAEIAERKRSEESLRAAEGRLLQALNAMPTIGWSAGPEGKVLAFNDRLTEYSGEAIAGEILKSGSWLELVHQEDLPKFLSDYEACLREGNPWEFENRLKRRDGVFRWHLVRLAPIWDREGNVDRWFATATDIHDLKVTNAALETLLENAPDGIFRIDRSLSWLYVNPAASRLFGEGPLAAISPSTDENLPSGVGLAIRRACADLFSGIEETKFSFEIGLRHYTVLAVRESKRDDLQSSALFVCHDVTGQIEAQEALSHMNEELERRVELRTQELAQSIEEIESFAYSISHDFRAPLRAISATGSILLEEFGERLGREGKEMLERQVQASSKLGNIIDDLLKFSRYSRAELQVTRVDLSRICQAIVEEFAILDRSVLDRVVIQAGIYSSCDPSLIRLVLANLIENAIKFSPSGSQVEIGITSEQEIFVRDFGVGFDLRYAEKIWRPFERLVTDQEFPGTGIGLANVKRIIERHKGRVWVESAPGKGSTFYFCIPADPVN